MNNWKELYLLAERIYALKPWRFLYEDNICGVRDPITGKIGFISVMGNLGEHYSIAVYLGEGEFGKFLELSRNPEDATPETILEFRQLMLSFENREMLEKEDRDILKQINRKYSGKSAWPLFRSFSPGMYPWFLTDEEQQSMIHYLEQFLEMLGSSDFDLKKSGSGSMDADRLLIREFTQVGEKISWKNTFQKITIPAPVEIPTPIPSGLLSKAKKTPVGNEILAIDFFLTPARVMEKDSRPFFPYLLLVVDDKRELVRHHDMLDPRSGLDSTLSLVPEKLLTFLCTGKSFPGTIKTTSTRLANLVFPVFQELGIKCQLKPHVKSIESAKAELLSFLSEGMM